MLNRSSRSDRGDTLIEVLFAVSVFSLIVVTALSIMNQGTALAQRSLETTLVRQQVDSQADTLRFLHESYVQNYYSGITFTTTDAETSPAEEFYKIVQHVRTTGATSASEFGSTACGTPPNGSFVLNTKQAQLSTNPTLFRAPETYAQAVYSTDTVLTNSDGLWIEAVRSGASAANTGSIDFHIRACWDAPGLEQPMNIGTIVRLYEPRS